MRMRKLAIRLLTVAVCAMPLTVYPIAPSADAATNGNKHVKKHARLQRAPAAQSIKSQNPFSQEQEEDDRDRKAGGGGGG
jgi:hypothetical protein